MSNKEITRVPEILPDNLAAESAEFVTFLKKYYEWMGQKGNPSEGIDLALKQRTLDNAVDFYLSSLYSELGYGFVLNNQANQKNIIDNLAEIYSAKGSLQSIKVMFRALFGEEIDIKLPKEQILKSSSGNWLSEYSVIVELNEGDLFTTVGKYVEVETSFPNTPKQTFDVEVKRIEKREGSNVYEVYVSRYFAGFFYFDSVIYYGDVKATLKSSMSQILNIEDSGTGFRVGETFVIADFVRESGFNDLARLPKSFRRKVPSLSKTKRIDLEDVDVDVRSDGTITRIIKLEDTITTQVIRGSTMITRVERNGKVKEFTSTIDGIPTPNLAINWDEISKALIEIASFGGTNGSIPLELYSFLQEVPQPTYSDGTTDPLFDTNVGATQYKRGDWDRDGEISIDDSMAILRYVFDVDPGLNPATEAVEEIRYQRITEVISEWNAYATRENMGAEKTFALRSPATSGDAWDPTYYLPVDVGSDLVRLSVGADPAEFTSALLQLNAEAGSTGFKKGDIDQDGEIDTDDLLALVTYQDPSLRNANPLPAQLDSTKIAWIQQYLDTGSVEDLALMVSAMAYKYNADKRNDLHEFLLQVDGDYATGRVRGDIDQSGLITLDDVSILLRRAAGYYDVPSGGIQSVNVNTLVGGYDSSEGSITLTNTINGSGADIAPNVRDGVITKFNLTNPGFGIREAVAILLKPRDAIIENIPDDWRFVDNAFADGSGVYEVKLDIVDGKINNLYSPGIMYNFPEDPIDSVQASYDNATIAPILQNSGIIGRTNNAPADGSRAEGVYEITSSDYTTNSASGTGAEFKIRVREGGGAGVNASVSYDEANTLDASRTEGVYDIFSGYTTDGSGTGAGFRVSVFDTGRTIIFTLRQGTGYVVGETITIPDSLLGSGGAAALTFDIGSIKTYDTLISVVDGGTGYLAGETFTVADSNLGGGGAPALTFAIADIADSNTITGFNIISGGTGYDIAAATVEVTDGTGEGIIFPTNPVGVRNGVIDKISLVSGGSGYELATTTISVTRNSVPITGATLTPVINSSGAITDITIEDGGEGYNPDIDIITIASSGSGQGANASEFQIIDGVVDAISISNNGGGYSSRATAVIKRGNSSSDPSIEAIVQDGVLTTVTVNKQGINYNPASTVSNTLSRVEPSLQAVLDSNGSITDIISVGDNSDRSLSGWQSATVSITEEHVFKMTIGQHLGNLNYVFFESTDRNGDVDDTTDPTINISLGDTVKFDLDYADTNTVNEFYIKTSQASGTTDAITDSTVTGRGTETVTFTPTSVGTYYYQSSVHSNMSGEIVVSNNGASFSADIDDGKISQFLKIGGGSNYGNPIVTLTGTRLNSNITITTTPDYVEWIDEVIGEPLLGSEYNPLLIDGPGTGANARVTKVGNNGQLQELKLTSFGFDYPDTFTTTISPENPAGTTAKVTLASSVVGVTSPKYVDRKGFLSDIIKIQDNDLYQEFSYVIQTGVDFDIFEDLIKKSVHPAGMKIFGEQNINESFALQVTQFDYTSSLYNKLVFDRTDNDELNPGGDGTSTRNDDVDTYHLDKDMGLLSGYEEETDLADEDNDTYLIIKNLTVPEYAEIAYVEHDKEDYHFDKDMGLTSGYAEITDFADKDDDTYHLDKDMGLTSGYAEITDLADADNDTYHFDKDMGLDSEYYEETTLADEDNDTYHLDKDMGILSGYEEITDLSDDENRYHFDKDMGILSGYEEITDFKDKDTDTYHFDKDMGIDSGLEEVIDLSGDDAHTYHFDKDMGIDSGHEEIIDLSDDDVDTYRFDKDMGLLSGYEEITDLADGDNDTYHFDKDMGLLSGYYEETDLADNENRYHFDKDMGIDSGLEEVTDLADEDNDTYHLDKDMGLLSGHEEETDLADEDTDTYHLDKDMGLESDYYEETDLKDKDTDTYHFDKDMGLLSGYEEITDLADEDLHIFSFGKQFPRSDDLEELTADASDERQPFDIGKALIDTPDPDDTQFIFDHSKSGTAFDDGTQEIFSLVSVINEKFFNDDDSQEFAYVTHTKELVAYEKDMGLLSGYEEITDLSDEDVVRKLFEKATINETLEHNVSESHGLLFSKPRSSSISDVNDAITISRNKYLQDTATVDDVFSTIDEDIYSFTKDLSDLLDPPVTDSDSYSLSKALLDTLIFGVSEDCAKGIFKSRITSSTDFESNPDVQRNAISKPILDLTDFKDKDVIRSKDSTKSLSDLLQFGASDDGSIFSFIKSPQSSVGTSSDLDSRYSFEHPEEETTAISSVEGGPIEIYGVFDMQHSYYNSVPTHSLRWIEPAAIDNVHGRNGGNRIVDFNDLAFQFNSNKDRDDTIIQSGSSTFKYRFYGKSHNDDDDRTVHVNSMIKAYIGDTIKLEYNTYGFSSASPAGGFWIKTSPTADKVTDIATDDGITNQGMTSHNGFVTNNQTLTWDTTNATPGRYYLISGGETVTSNDLDGAHDDSYFIIDVVDYSSEQEELGFDVEKPLEDTIIDISDLGVQDLLLDKRLDDSALATDIYSVQDNDIYSINKGIQEFSITSSESGSLTITKPYVELGYIAGGLDYEYCSDIAERQF